MVYLFKSTKGGEWSSINEVSKIEQCNVKSKADVGNGLSKLNEFAKLLCDV
jgi:hypothetical protein